MTNKESLTNLTSNDFYRKMKRLFMTKTKSEIIKWLDSDASKPDVTKRISGRHKCPYCGQVWVWSQTRWNIAREQGYLLIRCKKCNEDFIAYREKDGVVNEKI